MPGVRECSNDGRSWYQLLKAEDGTKDQSYFLHRLNQQQLARTLFPLGATCTSARCAGSPRTPACTSPTEEGLDRHLLHRRAPVQASS
jgi:hypothetical protein